MAVLPDYVTGTITLANGSATVTGTGTMFATAAFRAGDTLQIQNLTAVITNVDGNTQLTLAEPWTGTSIIDTPYRARYLPDGARVTAQTTTLIELLGNGVLSNIASLPVEDGKLLVGNAAGQYETIDKDELGTPDPNGSLGKLAALTLAPRQVLQTDAAGALQAITLVANKAIVTDANKDVQQIDLGTLGRALLALASGTNAQYVQGDGTLQAKTGLPISSATQTALDGKANLTGAAFTGSVTARTTVQSSAPRSTTTPGATNTGGFVSSGFTDAAYFARLVCQEVVGTTVRGVIHVSLDASNQAFFQFGYNGSLAIPGALSKGSGTFLIDHPLDPLNRNLRHGFVEAPRYDLIYRGTVRLVDGRATVDIDAASDMSSGTFAALTTNAAVASLQNQDGFTRMKPGAISGGSFEIICEDETCTDLVSWVVIAERNDPFVKSDLDRNTNSDGRFVPEFEKEDVL